jgi:hypothetical protein
LRARVTGGDGAASGAGDGAAGESASTASSISEEHTGGEAVPVPGEAGPAETGEAGPAEAGVRGEPGRAPGPNEEGAGAWPWGAGVCTSITGGAARPVCSVPETEERLLEAGLGSNRVRL